MPALSAADHLVELVPGWSLWRRAAVRGAGMPLSWLDAFAEAESGSERQAREISAAAVRALVQQPRFVEAVTWQNLSVIDNWLGRYAECVAMGDARLSRRDQREALVAFLAQRYCSKNETIGFFGPVAWASFDNAIKGLTQTGTGELRSRSLYLEDWAARAFAAAFAADERLLEHLVVRVNPCCAVRDGRALRPGRRSLALTAAEVAVMDAVAGATRVADLVAAVAADSPDALPVVIKLRDEGLLLIGIPIPLAGDPGQAVRAFLAELPDGDLRGDLVGRFDKFGACVDRIRACAGDPAGLREAMAAAEIAFAELVGQQGHRDKPARRYGRALVYEDCRRDTDVTIGGDLLQDLRGPLGLLLDSARWFVCELGEEVERDLLSRFRQLSASGRDVCLADLVLASADVLAGRAGTAVDRVTDDFLSRWSVVISAASTDKTSSRLDLQAAVPLVTSLFPAQQVRWRASIQHSPDVMLRATESGCQWVIGELHMALNTLENRPFLTQADDPAELLAATTADFASGRIVPLYPHDAPEVTSRTYPPLAMNPPGLYTYWSYASDDGPVTGPGSLPGAGLRVLADGSRLLARDDRTGLEGSVLEFLGEFLTALAVNRFQVRRAARHHPRLLLGAVVIERESWQIPLSEVPLAGADDLDYQHRRLRDWLLTLSTPRHVFVRISDTSKPYLVDRNAPLSLRNFVRSVRRQVAAHPGAELVMTEMLPGPDDLWLTDARGERYTSEFRVVAVDSWQEPRSPFSYL